MDIRCCYELFLTDRRISGCSEATIRGPVYAFRRLRRCNVRDQPVVIRDPVSELDAKVSQV